MGNCVAGVPGVCGGGPKHEARVGEVRETAREGPQQGWVSRGQGCQHGGQDSVVTSSEIVTLLSLLQENCTCLDNASILFINTSLLLEHRKDWCFLYSTQTHPRSLEV